VKRTALVRKTPLRAKGWGIGPSKKKRGQPLGDTRPLVRERARFRCEICGEPLRGDDWEDHHVFYRSHVAKLVRHELWNRMALCHRCHDMAHDAPAVRRRCEKEAIIRLYAQLGAQGVETVTLLLPVGATEPAAFVRAYESYSRGIR